MRRKLVSPRVTVSIVGLSLAIAAACSSGEARNEDGDDHAAGAGADACIPRSARPCTGPLSCRGVEECLPDGSGYAPCHCDGATGGASGNGGTTGSGGSLTGGESGSSQGGISGSATGGASGSSQGGISGSATGGASGSSSGSSSGGSSGSGGRVLKNCVEGCVTAADCGTGTPADSAVNYRCENGGCVRLGCQSDSECNAQSAGNVCRPYPDVGVNLCNRPCTGPEVCGDTTGATQAWGPDNYSCTGGVCVYRGCNSDAECLADFRTRPTAVCAHVASIPTCGFSCAVPADCAVLGSVAYDADNYRCEGGQCVYIGCLSDEECNGSVPGYVCRELVYGP